MNLPIPIYQQMIKSRNVQKIKLIGILEQKLLAT